MRLSVLLAVPLLFSAAPSLAAVRSFSPGGGFDRVETVGPFDVRIVAGRPGVSASGSQAMLDRITVDNQGGTLRLGLRRNDGWRGWIGGTSGRTLVTVTTPGVRAVRLTGPGDVTVDRMRGPALELALTGPGDLTVAAVETPSLSVVLTGPGNVRVAGRARTANLQLSGPGDIHGEALTVDDVQLRLAGPGDITVAAQRTATGRLAGPGDITVTGPARCDIRKAGPGEVRCRR